MIETKEAGRRFIHKKQAPGSVLYGILAELAGHPFPLGIGDTRVDCGTAAVSHCSGSFKLDTNYCGIQWSLVWSTLDEAHIGDCGVAACVEIEESPDFRAHRRIVAPVFRNYLRSYRTYGVDVNRLRKSPDIRFLFQQECGVLPRLVRKTSGQVLTDVDHVH